MSEPKPEEINTFLQMNFENPENKTLRRQNSGNVPIQQNFISLKSWQ